MHVCNTRKLLIGRFKHNKICIFTKLIYVDICLMGVYSFELSVPQIGINQINYEKSRNKSFRKVEKKLNRIFSFALEMPREKKNKT